MEQKYFTAAMAEDFFNDVAMVFKKCRDKIDSKKISEDDGRYYELFAVFVDNYAVNFEEEYKPLLHQLSLLLVNSNALYCIHEDEEYWQQQELFEEIQ